MSEDHVFRCKYCQSLRIIKMAICKNKSGDVQIPRCKDCKKCFSANIGFRYRQHAEEAITEAIFQYYSGMSVRAISEAFETRGIKATHMTVYGWIQRYSRVASKYVDSLTPKVGNRFRADEVWVNVEGQKKYLFASMDDETRYWLAFDLADTSTTTGQKICLK